jgi:tetratricopeptide (TPR) repeat protein
MPRYRLEILVGFLLVLTSVAAMAGVLENGFVNYDDGTYVVDNIHVRGGLTASELAWAFSSTYAGNWHPLTWISYLLDAEVFGLRPEFFHLTNLLIHVASVLALFGVLERMTGALWRSACVAALFGLHPLHVESVAWIAERKDVLSAFLGILTVGAYVRYVEQPTLQRYLLVSVCYALGLTAKPMLVTLPCLLLLLDYWPLGRWRPWGTPGRDPPTGGGVTSSSRRSIPFRLLLLEKVPLLGLATLASAATLYAQDTSGAVRSFEQVSLGLRAENTVLAYVYYLVKTFWPIDLAVYYPYLASNSPAWQAVAGGFFLAGVSVLVVAMGRRYPYLPVGWFWFVGTLVPVIGLVQVGSQGMADRYTYLPLIGLFIAVTWGVADLTARYSRGYVWVVPLTAAVLGACITLTRAQVGYWHDSGALWSHAIDVTGSNFVAENNLGRALFEQPGGVAKAEVHFANAGRLEPQSDEAEGNLGMAKLAQGKLEDAVYHLSRALALNPESAKTHNNLGLAMLYQGKPERAREHFLLALQLVPDMVDARANMGVALLQEGKPAEAIRELEGYLRVMRSSPNEPPYLNSLAMAYAQMGRFDDAVVVSRKALDIARKSGHADLASSIESSLRAYEKHHVAPGPAPGR